MEVIEVDVHGLNTDLTARAEAEEFSGVVRITRGGEELFAHAYGWASRTWRVPNTLDIRFDTASITKLFTSVAALQLVDKGELSLETKAVDYLGLAETSIHPDANLGQFLSHTSGIGDDAEEEDGEDYADIWTTRSNYEVLQTADFLPQFVNKPANFAPGEGCRYCNVGFILAGLMIERASGMTYRDRVRKYVFDAAGMHDSDFFHMDRVEPLVAEGVDTIEGGGWVRNIYSYPPVGSPDGGAQVTAADLERFLVAIQRGQLLSESSTAAFFRPVAKHSDKDGGELHYGYGLEFLYDDDDKLRYYEKEGFNAGVSAVLRHYPSLNTTVVLLCNTSRGAWEPREHIDSILTANTAIEESP